MFHCRKEDERKRKAKNGEAILYLSLRLHIILSKLIYYKHIIVFTAKENLDEKEDTEEGDDEPPVKKSKSGLCNCFVYFKETNDNSHLNCFFSKFTH